MDKELVKQRLTEYFKEHADYLEKIKYEEIGKKEHRSSRYLLLSIILDTKEGWHVANKIFNDELGPSSSKEACEIVDEWLKEKLKPNNEI